MGKNDQTIFNRLVFSHKIAGKIVSAFLPPNTLKHKSVSGSYKKRKKYVFTKLKMVAEHITVAETKQPVSVGLVLTQASSEKLLFAVTWLKS